MSTAGGPPPTDPVLARRAQAERLAGLGRTIAFSCFGLAVVVFVVGFVAGFTGLVATTVTVLLAVGSIVFIPAVIVGYGVKAADREDREQAVTRDPRS